MDKQVKKISATLKVIERKIKDKALNQKQIQPINRLIDAMQNGKINDRFFVDVADPLAALGLENKALDMLEAAFELMPGSDLLLEKFVLCARNQGREAKARHVLKGLMARAPERWLAHKLFSRMDFHKSPGGDHLHIIEKFIENNPDHIPALKELFEQSMTLGHVDTDPVLQKILDLEPHNIFAHSQRVQMRARQGMLEESQVSLDALSRFATDQDPLLWFCKGFLAQEKGQLSEALAHYNKALELDPHFIEAYGKSGGILLKLGQDLNEAWYRLEARFPQFVERPAGPIWRGEDLSSKSLLIWAEQGIGDQFSFASMLRDLPTEAEKIYLEVEPKLFPLYQRSFPDLEIIKRPKALKTTADYNVPIANLAPVLRGSVADFQKTEPVHFKADPERVTYWSQWLSSLGPGPKVGLCWRSGARSVVRERDGLNLVKDLACLWSLSDVTFVNLFYGDGTGEINAVKDQFNKIVHTPPGLDQFNDIDDLAALITSLDQVVGIASAPVRLAQGLGTETILLYTGVAGVVEKLWWPKSTYLERPVAQSWDRPVQELLSLISDN